MIRLMVCHYESDLGGKVRIFYKSFKSLDEVAKLIVTSDRWCLVHPKQTIKDLGKRGEYILYRKMDSVRSKLYGTKLYSTK